LIADDLGWGDLTLHHGGRPPRNQSEEATFKASLNRHMVIPSCNPSLHEATFSQ
jgi:hypothetical protein